MKDYLVSGIVDSKNVRVFACVTTNLLEEARLKHDLWPVASVALGRMMSVTCMMGKMVKGEEKITCIINGGGPIGTMMTVTNCQGKVKGFVANPVVHYTYNDTGRLAIDVAVGKNGYLEVIRDMQLKDTFSSKVSLQSGEIGDDFTYYFAASEQTPSVVSVGVLVNDTNEIVVSGGFIIQLLPNATEENIQFIEEKMKEVPPITTLLSEGKTPEDILKTVFDDVKILDTQDLFFECDCNHERMKEVLGCVGKDELQKMIEEDHGCEIRCHFCNTKYQFTEDELNEILKSKKLS